MKKLLFVGLLSFVALVGCQAKTTKPAQAPDSKAKTTNTATDTQKHTTLKPVMKDAMPDHSAMPVKDASKPASIPAASKPATSSPATGTAPATPDTGTTGTTTGK